MFGKIFRAAKKTFKKKSKFYLTRESKKGLMAT